MKMAFNMLNTSDILIVRIKTMVCCCAFFLFLITYVKNFHYNSTRIYLHAMIWDLSMFFEHFLLHMTKKCWLRSGVNSTHSDIKSMQIFFTIAFVEFNKDDGNIIESILKMLAVCTSFLRNDSKWQRAINVINNFFFN